MSAATDKLHLLYDTETTGGWTHGMIAIVQAMLEGLPVSAAPAILEVGCGSGATVRALRRLYPSATIAGLDLHPLALAYAAAAESGPVNVTRANLLHLPVADGRFDLLLALDSFDQSGVPLGDALAEARRALKPGGLLLLRVSAHPWLLGAHDVAFNTGRRYTRAEIVAALHGAGFDPLRLSYANSLLAPPVIVLRLAELWLGESGDGSLYSSALANEVVRRALSLEAGWIRRASLPFGLSLLAAARAIPAP